MRKRTKKLSLSRETIIRIQKPEQDLARVAAGLTASCPEDSWCACGWSEYWSCGWIGC